MSAFGNAIGFPRRYSRRVNLPHEVGYPVNAIMERVLVVTLAKSPVLHLRRNYRPREERSYDAEPVNVFAQVYIGLDAQLVKVFNSNCGSV